MRKLVLALVATTAIVGQASADVKSGFYVGANVSANALLAKGKWSYDYTATPTNPFINSKSDLGRFGGGAGAYVGYGAVLYNCYYLAGELAYNWNSAKAKHSTNSSSNSGNNFDGAGTSNPNAPEIVRPNPTITTSNTVSMTIKNQSVFNFAALAGFKVTPATIFYFRLGGNVSEARMTANVLGVSIHKKKTRLSFVPGAGMETTFNKNWVARMEYTYDLGSGTSHHKHGDGDSSSSSSSTTVNNNSSANEHFNASAKRVNTHSVKLGIAYKF